MSTQQFLSIDHGKAQLLKVYNEVTDKLRDAANLTEAFTRYLEHVYPGSTHLPSTTIPAATSDQHHQDEPAGKRKRKQKREKKPKDPNAPKRPPSAYLLYQNDVRKTMQEKFKDLSYREVLAEIAKTWNDMSESDKKMYNDATAIAKLKYNDAKAAYEGADASPKHKADGQQAEAGPTSSEEGSEDDSDNESDASQAERPPHKKKAVGRDPEKKDRRKEKAKKDT